MLKVNNRRFNEKIETAKKETTIPPHTDTNRMEVVSKFNVQKFSAWMEKEIYACRKQSAGCSFIRRSRITRRPHQIRIGLKHYILFHQPKSCLKKFVTMILLSAYFFSKLSICHKCVSDKARLRIFFFDFCYFSFVQSKLQLVSTSIEYLLADRKALT